MPDRYEHLAQLIAGHLRQDLTVEEQAALATWLAERPENRRFLDELEDTRHLQRKLRVFHDADRERLWALTQAKLADGGFAQPQRPIRYVGRWLPYAAALLVGVVVVAWLFFDERTDNKSGTGSMQVADIPPGGNRATLTLADGRTVTLDEARDGIVIGSGEITYNDGNPLADGAEMGERQGEVPLLELTTPKGGTYQITLSDGTKVWLNAASTLKYPPHFSGTGRIVELTGEAYFSVAKDAKKPFKVVSEGQEVQVLGTEFNVSAYPDDPETETTLLEGSVSVRLTADLASPVVIQPGQQSTLRGAVIDVKAVDVMQYVAWKEGLFYFDHTSFDKMIRQIGRWYDIEVNYHGEIPKETFTGKIQRDLSLMAMLDLLNISDAKIHLQGRTLIVR